LTTTICVLSGLVAGGYSGAIIPAVARAVSPAGGRVLAMQTVATGIDYHEEIALDDLAHVGWQGISGFITIANAVPRDYLEAIRDAGKPVVSIGNDEPGFACPAVLADNAGGTRDAVEHLLAHGHRRIAFVGYLGEFDIRERYEAYRSTLLDHGLQPDPELLFPAPNNLENGGMVAARALLAAGLPSTAVFAATDLNAVGTMKVLQAAGLGLPADQAIAGFDDDPDAELVSPALSTVTHDVGQLGRLATDLLLRQLAGLSVRSGRHVVPTAYLARESCGCSGAENSLTLAKSLLAARNDSYYELRKMVRDDYSITIDLLYHDRDPRLLDWLQKTGARAGALGLWQDKNADGGGRADPGPGGAVDIAGTFAASGDRLQLSSYSTDVESFPPEELFEMGEGQDVVYLFPLKSAKADWGFLAIAQPLVASLEQEAYFTWSALFSEALYQRQLLRSLSARSDELAISYQREREMAAAVRASEQRYALAARAANDGLWDWDLTTGTVYLSPRLQEMLGVDQTDIESGPDQWLKHVHPDDRAGLLAAISGLKTGETTSMTYELRAQVGDGPLLWALCRILAVPGKGASATRIVGSMTDVTERRSLEEQLRRQALYDHLTGLPNRQLFLDRLSQAMLATKRQPQHSYTVLWMDLDNFKRVNDTMGHLFGDQLLIEVADRIRAHVRESDTAARYGGDEFLVLLQDARDAAMAEGIVHRLSEHLRQPYVLRGEIFSITASIGVAVGGTGYATTDDILRDADRAMYMAKSSGTGICRV
jgi:diguanylate cyclase (GGDEF)-like protein